VHPEPAGTELVVPTEPGSHALLTIKDLTTNVARIHTAMKEVMKEGVHYGIIPGTPKKSLWKPGAEVIATMFRFAAYPVVQDLSTADKVHYRVTIHLTHAPTGTNVTHGVGECSSDEEKYRWRKAVCDAEWQEEDPARRRNVWKKGDRGSTYQVKQVRTNPADVANTILKMAKKRGFIDAILTGTAASDLFGQDAEDLSPELRAEIYGEEQPAQAEPVRPTARTPDAGGAEGPVHATASQVNGTLGGKIITGAQLKILRSQLANKSIAEPAFCQQFKIASIELLPFEHINDAMKWIAERQ
jgi:hypothetical protein